MTRKYKFLSLAVLILAFTGCVRDVLEMPVPSVAVETDDNAPVFRAGFDSAGPTKTYIGEDGKLYWNSDDRVSVFNATTDNQQYVFGGKTGDRGGELSKVASGSTPSGKSIAANYAVYPYGSSVSINEDGLISLDLPSHQTYTEGSFSLGANTMVAVTSSTSDTDFIFSNVGGYLVVNLYGTVRISSITLQGNNGEKISGKADLRAVYGSAPAVTMHSDASTSITMDCSPAVQLSEESSTEFWFVIPPTTFSKGFSVSITDAGGKVYTKTISGRRVVERNHIATMSASRVGTKPGEFVRLLDDQVIFTKSSLTDLAYDKFGDQIPDGIIGTLIVGAVTEILGKNGDLVVNRIVYTTTDPDGNVIEASGLVSYPKKVTSFSKLLSVQHGTCDIDEAPTADDFPIELAPVFKGGNQVVVLADYLGYGVSRTSDLQHPYMHSELTGNTCADLIQAAESFLMKEKGLPRSSTRKIDLIGYSQGGSATISTLLELEKRGYGSSIGEVIAGSGPYDLNAFFNMFIASPDVPFSRMGFIPFLIRGLVYGDRLDVDYQNLFAQDVFTSGAFQKFSTTQVSSWHSRLGSYIKKVLHPDFFDVPSYNSNQDVITMANALQRNSVSNMAKPSNASKIVLYHSPNDNVVPYVCSQSLSSSWGCKINNLETEDHVNGAVEFYVKYVKSDLWSTIKSFL